MAVESLIDGGGGGQYLVRDLLKLQVPGCRSAEVRKYASAEVRNAEVRKRRSYYPGKWYANPSLLPRRPATLLVHPWLCAAAGPARILSHVAGVCKVTACDVRGTVTLHTLTQRHFAIVDWAPINCQGSMASSFRFRVAAAAGVFVLLSAGGLATCPNGCSKNGVCSLNNTCTCEATHMGADCSLRRCPNGTAWADFPTATDAAHATAECSNMGISPRHRAVASAGSFAGNAC